MRKRERKERIKKFFIGLRSWPTSLLKNNAQLAKRNLFMKNGSKVRMTLHLAISVVTPVGRDRKIRTALRNHQIAGFASVPSKKKISTPHSGCEVIFFEPWRGERKYEQSAKLPLVSDVKLSINGFIIPLLFSVISVLILVCELHPMALSVYRIGRIRCPFFLKSSLLKTVKLKRKLNKRWKFGSFRAMLLRILGLF